MTVITISRQIGSQGDRIAELIAEQLGYRVVSRQLINQAAAQACAPEMALAEIDELGLLGISPSEKDCISYIKQLKRIVLNLAAEGRVIVVGRGGQIILKDHPNALHIRIIAPFEVRVSRIMQQQNISYDAAKAQTKASDQNREKFLKRLFEAKLSKPEFYDLIINTAHIDPDSAAQIILTALHQKNPTVL